MSQPPPTARVQVARRLEALTRAAAGRGDSYGAMVAGWAAEAARFYPAEWLVEMADRHAGVAAVLEELGGAAQAQVAELLGAVADELTAAAAAPLVGDELLAAAVVAVLLAEKGGVLV